MQHGKSPELANVQEELDATKKKLERYTDLIAKLYDELDSLRSTIASCETCNKKVAKSSTAAGHRSRSPVPLWRRVLGSAGRQGHSRVQNPDKSLQVPPIAAAPLVHSSSEQVVPVNHAHTKPLPVLPAAVAPLTHGSTETAVPSDYAPTTLLPVENVDNSLELKPDWSVEYNPDIQQTLDIQLVETITCNSCVFMVKFSRSGKHLAVGLVNGEIDIYDLKTLSKSLVLYSKRSRWAEFSVSSIQFSPHDVYIALGLSDGRIPIWNVAQKRVHAVLKGHTSLVSAVDFSPDGRFLASVSWDNTIRIWRMRDGSSTELLDFDFWYNSVAFSPLGRYIFCGGDSYLLRIWDTRSDKLVAKWTSVAGRIATFSQDRKVLVSGGEDKDILKYWDVGSYTGPGVNVEERPEEEILRFKVGGHTSYIHSIALSSDTRLVFSTSKEDSSIRIWDAKKAALHCSLKGHSRGVMAVDASPTSQLVASGSRDGRVRLWQFNVTE